MLWNVVDVGASAVETILPHISTFFDKSYCRVLYCECLHSHTQCNRRTQGCQDGLFEEKFQRYVFFLIGWPRKFLLAFSLFSIFFQVDCP